MRQLQTHSFPVLLQEAPSAPHQALSYDKQTLTSPSESVLCLIGINVACATFSSDTRHCPTLKSKSVSSHSKCMFCPTTVPADSGWRPNARWRGISHRGCVTHRNSVKNASIKSLQNKPPFGLWGGGMVPKGLLTFLGFVGNAEFSPRKRLPGFIELGVH